ncbi:MAG: polysaccharide deacetylase family protein [Elusimicrobiota bacterium]
MIKVLFAHDVQEKIPGKYGIFSRNIVLTNEFKSIIQKISRYNTINLKENPEFVEFNEPTHKKNFLLTFDDGYKSIKKNALPVLEKYGVPCLFFITTGFINGDISGYELQLSNYLKTRNNLEIPKTGLAEIGCNEKKEKVYKKIHGLLKFKNTDFREKYMNKIRELNNIDESSTMQDYFLTWDEIKYLDNHPLITIGAHSHSHVSLPAQKISVCYKEINKSKKILESKLGHKIEYFSYPYGRNNFITRIMVRIKGFKYVFCTGNKCLENNSKINNYAIPRLDVKKVIKEGF